MRFDRCPDIVNAAWHTSHLYGRSPVCVRVCTTNVLDVTQYTLAKTYASPVCVRMCLDRCPDTVNAA